MHLSFLAASVLLKLWFSISKSMQIKKKKKKEEHKATMQMENFAQVSSY